MTLTYGFYNSVSSDRLYSALQMSRIFDGIIEDGVYASIGDKLMVTEDTGMDVTVGTGRAWFNHTWSYNDADITVTVSTADALLPRIDVVYLEVNEDTGVRANSIGIVAGTPASTPVAPTLTSTATVHQYPLAHIAVGAAVTSIVQANITNKVGTTSCPFVTGPLSVVSVSELLTQWNSEFDIWFDAIKGQLTTEAEGNLQSQIYAIVGDVNPPLIDLITLKDHGHTGGEGISIATAAIANDAVTYDKAGDGLPKLQYRIGGSSTNWNTGGSTSYSPGAVKEFVGAYSKSYTYNVGTTYENVVCQFPGGYAFSYVPLLFSQLVLVSYSHTGDDLGVPRIVGTPSTTSVTVQVPIYKVTAAGTISWGLQWRAIGPG